MPFLLCRKEDGVAELPFDRLKRLSSAAGLLKVAESTSHGQPCLRRAGKVFATIKGPTTAVHFCPLDQKGFLLEVAPEIYWQTDHFKGWPALLVRLDIVLDDELQTRLIEAWRYKVSKTLVKRYESQTKSASA
jgi:hypothetical protein